MPSGRITVAQARGWPQTGCMTTIGPGHRALRKGRASLAGQAYLLTAVVSCRRPLFADIALGMVACRELHRMTRDGGQLETLCWVLMPDHLHLLARLADGDLSRAMGNLKARISHEVNRARGSGGGIWSRGFHDRAIRREQDLRDVARYVIANPVRARLVESVRAYPFWDAKWL